MHLNELFLDTQNVALSFVVIKIYIMVLFTFQLLEAEKRIYASVN